MRIFLFILFLLFAASFNVYYCDDNPNLLSELFFCKKDGCINLEKKSYKNGDYLKFNISSEKSGYFMVFHIDASGESSVIIPKDAGESCFIFKNQIIKLPNDCFLRLNANCSGSEFLILLSGIDDYSDYRRILRLFEEQGIAAVKDFIETSRLNLSVACSEYDYTFIPASNTYVLSIGIDEYANLTNLKSSVSDTLLFAETVKKYCFIPEENIFILKNKEATKRNIEDHLKILNSINSEDKDIIFFFSGHGKKIPDLNGDEKDGFDESICPWEFKEGDELTYFIDDEIAQYIDLLESNSRRLTFIIDACFSGHAYKTFNPDFFDEKEIDEELSHVSANAEKEIPVEKNEQGFCFFGSSGSSELSIGMNDELGNGIFTYFLVNAFKGFAEYNGDGMLDSEEIYRYVCSELEIYSKAKKLYFQTPVRYPKRVFLIMGELQ